MIVLPTPHADYERDHPDEAEYAIEMDRHARAMHIQRCGSIEGYTPARSFPCLGWIREAGRTDSMRELECDGCDFQTTAPIRVSAERVSAGRADW